MVRYKLNAEVFDKILNEDLVVTQAEFCKVVGITVEAVSAAKSLASSVYFGPQRRRRVLKGLPKKYKNDDIFIAIN